MRGPFKVIVGLSLGLSAVACNFALGSDSAGEKGVVRFEYQSNQCAFGCALDRPALEGSAVTVSASGGAVDKHLHFVFEPGDVAAIKDQTESCSCESSDGKTSTTGGTELACKAGEKKSCSRQVTLETKTSGDGKLSVREDSGAIVDQIDLKVRAAGRVDVEVRAGQQPQKIGPDATGTYVVKRGDKVEIKSTVFDASGKEVVFTYHGVGHEYSDKTVLAPDEKVILGASDVEYVTTGRAGDATVRVTARGAEAKAAFRVVP